MPGLERIDLYNETGPEIAFWTTLQNRKPQMPSHELQPVNSLHCIGQSICKGGGGGGGGGGGRRAQEEEKCSLVYICSAEHTHTQTNTPIHLQWILKTWWALLNAPFTR